MAQTALIVLTVILAALGVGLSAVAWTLAGSTRPVSVSRSAVVAGLGSGFLTGAAVSIGVIILQQVIQDAGAENVWRGNVTTSWKMAGLDARGHDLHNPTVISFAGKELPDAVFEGMHLEGISFRDATLRGAVFDGAKLARANLVAADASTAVFKGADLSDAHLESTNFSGANVETATLSGAHVNDRTCWPRHFLTNPKLASKRAGLIGQVVTVNGKQIEDLGREYPCKTSAVIPAPAPSPSPTPSSPTPSSSPAGASARPTGSPTSSVTPTTPKAP